MKPLYVESSAILAWLFEEKLADEVIATIDSSTVILTSSLTLLEVNRSIIRAQTLAAISRAEAIALTENFNDTFCQWKVMEITMAIRIAAQQRFPKEPVRSLDAIHLATILEFAKVYTQLKVLSHDIRIKSNIEALGL